MIHSLRWRLQLWYAAVLVVVVGSFAGILYYRERQGAVPGDRSARWRAGGALPGCGVAAFPPFELDSNAPGKRPPEPPPFGKDPKGKDPKGKGPPRKDGKKDGPPPRPLEHLLADLELPNDVRRSRRTFRVRVDGTVLKAVGMPTGTGPPTFDDLASGPQIGIATNGRREARRLGPWRYRVSWLVRP